MTDPIELRLRAAIKSASLPGAPESLRGFLDQLPAQPLVERRGFRPSPLLLAATIALLVLAAMSAVFIGSQLNRAITAPTATPTAMPTPTQGPTPVPTAVPRTDAAAALLDRFPALELRVERSGESAEPEQIQLDQFSPIRRFMVALWCEGQGSLAIEARNPNPPRPTLATPFPDLGPPFWTADAVCDGEVAFAEMNVDLAFGARLSAEIDGAGRWHVAVAEYPQELIARPESFGAPVARDGWTLVRDATSDAISSSLNPAVFSARVPNAASRVGVVVWCSFETAVDLTVNEDIVGAAECPTADAGARFEMDVTGGELLTIVPQPDFATWVRIVVDADADDPAPSPPPLPSEIAETYFAVVSGEFTGESYTLRIGQIGRADQVQVPVTGFASAVRGSVLVVAGQTADGRATLELRNPETGEVTDELVRAEPGTAINHVAVDLESELVYYSMDFEFRVVGLDGSGDREVASLPGGESGGVALALGRGLVKISCTAAAGCSVTLASSSGAETEPRAIAGTWTSCAPLGSAQGLIAALCENDENENVWRVVVMDDDGGNQRVIGDGNFGTVVATREGPKLVFARESGEIATWTMIDLVTGASTDLGLDLEDPYAVSVADVGLPQDWVLLAADLADQDDPTLGRPAPRLVNLVTGEIIRLSHLPNEE
jgi:hypothetical protein